MNRGKGSMLNLLKRKKNKETRGDWRERLTNRDTVLVCLLSFLLLAVVGVAANRETGFEWRTIQRDFTRLIAEKFGPEKAANIETGVRQIWVPELGRTDRCITCHLGLEWKGLEEEEHPFATHPHPELIQKHPFSKFGCTVCHGGQGYSTDVMAAHGWVSQREWNETLMASYIADDYLISDRSSPMQANCNICHRYETDTEGMEFINKGKELVSKNGCRACHIINDRGGIIGPDLTYEGDKHPEEFGFENVAGYGSVFNWHVEHIKNAKSIVPTSIMPEFRFTSDEVNSIALLMMSWRKEDIPVDYLPGRGGFREVLSPEEIAREEEMMNGPGAMFVNKGCFACHSVAVYQVFSPTNLGPDLSNAYEDVPIRFTGRTLEDFLKAPTGTMDFILKTAQYKFKDEAEADEFIEKIKEANKLVKEYEEKGLPLPSQE